MLMRISFHFVFTHLLSLFYSAMIHTRLNSCFNFKAGQKCQQGDGTETGPGEGPFHMAEPKRSVHVLYVPQLPAG